MENITGFGSKVQIVASVSFPAGFTITQFPGDTDPFDLPSLQIADKEMGVNGDLATWAKATPVDVSIAVYPGSQDDKNLSVIYEANRVGKGKNSANDIISMVIVSPDGEVTRTVNGIMTDAMPGFSVASEGRQKTKVYIFAFENIFTN